MGMIDMYCSLSGLPMRKIYDDNNVIPKEIQKILDKGVFVLDGKKINVKNYDGYGRFENSKGETVDVSKYMYSNDHKTDLFHKGIEKYPYIIQNKDIVVKLFQSQFFDDEEYIKFYQEPEEYKKNLVYHPKSKMYRPKTQKYKDKDKDTPAGKVLNPDTMRFVKVSSVAGKMIIDNRM